MADDKDNISVDRRLNIFAGPTGPSVVEQLLASGHALRVLACADAVASVLGQLDGVACRARGAHLVQVPDGAEPFGEQARRRVRQLNALCRAAGSEALQALPGQVEPGDQLFVTLFWDDDLHLWVSVDVVSEGNTHVDDKTLRVFTRQV